ncbi:peptide ABC transporter substrate-binding protein [Sphaerisporangium melleum]|uniref:Peptide ABC transporter substrate-binding protein n=1 Tax=Sphaerisporangium melleum TaxID=321316 RepID=A0A917VTW7_9ACTN|nr:ABC transporter substrate-binding protein [Sphaerisporangium melleum]GGL17338.1 peptide ABC transporter substrate-binding protein [Sphaerisporangium melleum]GII74747.1 peptide ABC transporter substrate-binding protein [Sphaerisporangium melleum]
MKRRTTLGVTALGAVLALGLSACGGGGAATPGQSGAASAGGGDAAKAEFNAALTQVFNPSDKKGGIIKLANAGDWDSLDPGDTYYGYSWDFIRLYGRSLVMFKPAPGKESAQLIPDLAESLGVPSDNAKTWTYKLKQGVKFEDGTPITSKDVKYGVERSFDKEVFPDGYTYFNDTLDWPKGYKGAYKSKDANTDSAIETPDDQTIVFHLKQPYSGFDYFAQLPATIPVPKDKDTGAKYKEHVISSGPYKFDKNEIGKGFTLVRNENWDPATDPNRKALPDGYEVTTNVNADDIDNRLLSGDLHLDIAGTGAQPATLGRVLTDPNLKAGTDNPTITRLWYTSVNGNVKPLDNIECRKAVQYAADKVAYQTAYGGEFSGGQIATSLLPPGIPGHEDFNLYPPGPDNHGDIAKAKEHLTACGQPNGFETNISYRAERPKEKAAAEALQQSLAKAGIKLTLKPFPQADYFALYAGKPGYAKDNKIGLAVNGWGADWPDGYGFLQQIVDSRVIRETGGSSNVSVRDPEVDKLLDQASLETDVAKREPMWAQIDRKVMEDAFILPGIWAKSLLIRGKGLTNVYYSDAFGMYDYLNMGLQ